MGLLIELGETITDNINITAKVSLGYYGPEKHRPWFDQGYSKLLV
jgi:hypothetical protein